mmetsp:Transcript_8336/g.13948  ORF Transcript_8336/g.13948 Transcript_8336/m.13948 type:complete len:97 (+) Transcript_8336:941-1231(+)
MQVIRFSLLVFLAEILAVAFLSDKMFALFTSDKELLFLQKVAFPYVLAFCLLDFWQGIFGGVIRALGKQGVASVVTFVCYYLVVLPLTVILAFYVG